MLSVDLPLCLVDLVLHRDLRGVLDEGAGELLGRGGLDLRAGLALLDAAAPQRLEVQEFVQDAGHGALQPRAAGRGGVGGDLSLADVNVGARVRSLDDGVQNNLQLLGLRHAALARAGRLSPPLQAEGVLVQNAPISVPYFATLAIGLGLDASRSGVDRILDYALLVLASNGALAKLLQHLAIEDLGDREDVLRLLDALGIAQRELLRRGLQQPDELLPDGTVIA
mmetsp:Transcript_1376/g.3473  ORF Transcript_1376/g.3473 Transcript_1376/m.3473 type:complete len:225 (+) Transcript_1376:2165-2839(+)